METPCTIKKENHSLDGLKGFILRRGEGDMTHMVKVVLFVPNKLTGTYDWQTWWFLLTEIEEELAKA